MGVLVWPMVKFEADDALASAAAKAAKDKRVRQVIICTPDKDLSLCVVRSRVVQLDRRREILRDEAGVIAKFGIKPSSIPDYLAVVGDSADGYPGIAGWGSKAAAAVFSRYLWKIFRRIGVAGIRRWGERVRLLRRFSPPGTMRSCFALSRRFESTFPYSNP
jgi:5'-3' exonuclease